MDKIDILIQKVMDKETEYQAFGSQEEITDLENAKAVLKKEFTDLQAELASANESIKRLRNSISTLRHEFISLQDELAETRCDKNRYQRERDDFETWYIAEKQKLREVQAELDGKKKLSGLACEIEKYVEQKDRLHSR